MEVKHYVAAMLVVVALNWGGRRFGSRQANKFTFFATAGMPIVLWIGLLVSLLFRDGISTFQSPYFSTLLMLVVGATIVTAAAALLGQVIGRPRRKGQP